MNEVAVGGAAQEPRLKWASRSEDEGQSRVTYSGPRTFIPNSNATAARATQHASKFRRECLPVARVYYSKEGLKLIGRGEWRSALCPFHDDRHPSLRIHFVSGAFRCMACGEKGGDVLAYHMARHRLSFVAAAKDLGAWEGGRS